MCISTPICEVVEPKWELLSGWARGSLISSSPWSHLAHLCYCCWCCDPQWSQKDRFSSPESQEEFYHNYLFTWLIRTRWTQRALRVRLSREARRPVGNWEAGRLSERHIRSSLTRSLCFEPCASFQCSASSDRFIIPPLLLPP